MNTGSTSLTRSLLLFLLIFGILYGGMQAWIGATSPGGRFYLPWVQAHFNGPAALRFSLLQGAAFVLDMLAIDTYMPDPYHLRVIDGRGIRMVYSCMGYGILSFWAAFALSFAPNAKFGWKWLAFGWFVIWSLNVLRLVALLIATNRSWPMPLSLDHHTLFNLVLYLGIGLMMFRYDRGAKRS